MYYTGSDLDSGCADLRLGSTTRQAQTKRENNMMIEVDGRELRCVSVQMKERDKTVRKDKPEEQARSACIYHRDSIIKRFGHQIE